jgi:hypothetical protein
MFKKVNLFLAVALTLCAAACGTGSTTETAATTTTAATTARHVTMQPNTAIDVTLVDAIDTDEDVTGDGFRARLNRPIVVNGTTVFAEGAGAKGVLNKVVESGHLQTPAELNFSLTSIQDQDGRWVSVGTNTIREKKASHTNREVAMIGGGAIVGGIIGKIINKDGSTEIGAATGAAVGLGAAAATGKQDIYHGVGTEVTFFSSTSTQIAL